jgi:hypothetical protein
VVDDQQPAARGQRVRGPPQDAGARQVEGRVQVVRRYEVEAARGEGRGQVVPLGGDPVAEPEVPRLVGQARDRDAGDVGRGHAPAAAGEPQRVAAGAAAQVERRARRQVGHDLGEPDVRAGIGSRRRVVAVPEFGGGHEPTVPTACRGGTVSCRFGKMAA